MSTSWQDFIKTSSNGKPDFDFDFDFTDDIHHVIG